MCKGPEEDPVVGIGNLWDKQDRQTYEFDFARYNSLPWVLIKTLLALCMMTLVFLLYALHELPWSLFGSVIGILILALTPFFAGLILGFTFERPWFALVYSVLIGFASIGLCIMLMVLPRTLELSVYQPGFMVNVWFYGFFIPFLIMISFVPAGAMLSSSTNVYE